MIEAFAGLEFEKNPLRLAGCVVALVELTQVMMAEVDFMQITSGRPVASVTRSHGVSMPSPQTNRPRDVLRIKDIADLSNDRIDSLKQEWRAKFGIERLDLVTGGPPYQGYSGIGHQRPFKSDKSAIPSNQLFKEMVRVIKGFEPKVSFSKMWRDYSPQAGPSMDQVGDFGGTCAASLFLPLGGDSRAWPL